MPNLTWKKQCECTRRNAENERLRELVAIKTCRKACADNEHGAWLWVMLEQHSSLHILKTTLTSLLLCAIAVWDKSGKGGPPPCHGCYPHERTVAVLCTKSRWLKVSALRRVFHSHPSWEASGRQWLLKDRVTFLSGKVSSGGFRMP